MRCGEKCFYVTIEKGNETKDITVNARTTAEARKTVRSVYGRETTVLFVRRKNKTLPKNHSL
ncbi:hypothetical protein [Piscibacillus halophilus]|uniref:hypothetical protein n=1 Tax=Piscibacillus halophilus TaxID=571933 RepID=UPI002409C80B|nr:hypothetical protein [Piscibacillus halophilus]